ncbi:MAG: hypothetical protein JO224_11250 [Pelomonas sp.]|nr:hypothetical protein [Roseateles sp.]
MLVHLIAACFAGAFLANAVPHSVAGMMGRRFQSPFAKPPGRGLSSPTVNVLWGAFNAVVGGLLAAAHLHDALAVGVAGVGALLLALYLAHRFGPINDPAPAADAGRAR